MPGPLVVTPVSPTNAAPPPAPADGAKPPPGGTPGSPPVVPTETAQPGGQPDPKLLREQFQKLTQREKATLAERQKLAEDKRSLEAERAAFKSEREESQRWKQWKEGAKKDPEALLRPIYGDNWYEALTEFRLDKRPPPSMEVAQVREELQQFKEQTAKERAESERQAKERAEQEVQQTVETFNRRAADHVRSAGEKYELINLTNSHDYVPELISQNWRKQSQDGIPEAERKLLSVDEAAQQVEEWLEKQWEEMRKSKKLTNKLQPATPSNGKTLEGSPREPRTLQNGLTGTSAPPAAGTTEADRVKRAFAAYDAIKASRQK